MDFRSKKKSILLIYSFLQYCLCIFIFINFSLYSLNKSRLLLSKEQFNSFFTNYSKLNLNNVLIFYKGIPLIVEKKVNNEVQNIFMHDKSNNLRNLSSNITKTNNTTIIAENGLVDQKKIFLFNSQIISSKKKN